MSCDALKYTVVQLSQDNMDDMAKLYHAVYQKVIANGYFPDKYNTAYTGAKYIGYLAYNELAEPIAFYGVIPCFFEQDGKTVLAAQSADTMTHPKYQGNGLFTLLANHTFKLCKKNGIRFVFGFPNQNSYPGFVNKLAAQNAGNMDCFIIPASKYNWEKLLNNIPFVSRIYTGYVKYILKKHEVQQPGLNNSVLLDGFNGLQRNAEYLKYKKYNKSYVIKAGQALVWFKIKNGLVIGDINLATDDFDSVMQTISKLAQKLGVKQILFHTSPGTYLHQLFDINYFPIPSFPVIFIDLGHKLPLSSFKFTTADIDTF